MRSILGPAIRKGKIVRWSVIPASHYSVIVNMRKEGIEESLKGEQGFITNTLKFVTREEAYVIAARAGQIVSHVPILTGRPMALFSEDLWSQRIYGPNKESYHDSRNS